MFKSFDVIENPENFYETDFSKLDVCPCLCMQRKTDFQPETKFKDGIAKWCYVGLECEWCTLTKEQAECLRNSRTEYIQNASGNLVKEAIEKGKELKREIFELNSCEYRIKPEKTPIESEETAGNKLRCFKCGKELNADNMSNVIYTSNPPKYTCKDCEKQADKNDEAEYEPFSSCSDLIDFCGTKLIYVINKKYKTEMLITGFDDEGLPPQVLLFGDMWVTLSELFENYTFCAGHPCGKHIYTEEK